MDVHFNATKVKFETLNALTKSIFDTNPIKSINIFINFDNFYGRLKNTSCNMTFQSCGANATKQLISNVLNLIGHYRQWGVRKHVDVKVYGYYTLAERSFENKIYIPDYRSRFVKSISRNNPDCYYVNTVIRDASDLLKSITNYIDGVYMIDSHFTEPSTMPLFIQSEVHTADWNFIITRDRFEYQYVLQDRFSVIVPKGDESFMVTAGNLWETIAKHEHFDYTQAKYYPPKLYPLVLAVMGDKHRSIPKLKRISWISIFNFLDATIDNGHESETTIFDNFLSNLCSKYADSSTIMNSFHAVDVHTNYTNMDYTTKSYISSQLVDVPDYENLLALNQMPNMFLNYPINLKFLTDAGDSYTTNPFKK